MRESAPVARSQRTRWTQCSGSSHHGSVITQLVNAWVDESHQIDPVHADQFTVRTGAEGDLCVLGEAGVGVDRHIVKVAEWWHGAGLAIGEGVFELALGGECDLLGAGNCSEPVKIHVQRCWNHRHRQDAIDFDDHGLCQFLAGDVGECGNTLSGVGERMRDDEIFYVVRIEKTTKLGERHTTSSWGEKFEGPVTRSYVLFNRRRSALTFLCAGSRCGLSQ